MTMYNARIELNEKNVPAERADAILDRLDTYNATVGQSPRRWLNIHLTFPAESLQQATSTAIALAESASGARAIVVEVMLESEFDAREGFEHIPDLIGAMEAATLLGVSRVRIVQMIEEGKFTSAQRIGRGWAVARSEVDAKVKDK